MSLANRLLDIFILMKPMIEGSTVKRVLPHLLTVIVLAVASALIGTIVLIGLFYVLYLLLVMYDFTPFCALLTTLGVAIFLLLVLVLNLRCALCKLKKSALPAPTGLTGIVESFMEGVRVSKRPK